MSRIFKIASGMLALWMLPLFVGAQVGGVSNTTSTFDLFITKLSGWIDRLLPLIVALALLYFLWGLIKYITSGGNEEARTEARKMMVWGIIALFVMVSVWGLVSFLGQSLGIDQGGSLDSTDVPGATIPGGSGSGS